MRVVFGADVPPPRSWPEGCEALALTPRAWSLRVQGPLGPVVALLAGLPVADLDVHEPHLEEVLRRYYKDEVS